MHLTGQPFALQQRLVPAPVPTLNLRDIHNPRDGSQPSGLARPGSQLSQLSQLLANKNMVAENDEDGSLSARSNGSASIGKGPSAFSPRR